LKTRFFGFHRDLPPQRLRGFWEVTVVFSEQRQGQWVAVIEVEKDGVQNAEARMQK